MREYNRRLHLHGITFILPCRGSHDTKPVKSQVTLGFAEVGGAEAPAANRKGRILDSERSVGLGLRRFSSPQKIHSPEAAFSFLDLHPRFPFWAAVGHDDASQTV